MNTSVIIESATETPTWLCSLRLIISTGNVVYSRRVAITTSPRHSAIVRNIAPSTAVWTFGRITRTSV